MANGTEQDIREIRQSVGKLETEGCAHKKTHDRDIEKAHERITHERTERDKFEQEVNNEMKKLKDSLTLRIVVALLGTAALNFAGAYYLLHAILPLLVK